MAPWTRFPALCGLVVAGLLSGAVGCSSSHRSEAPPGGAADPPAVAQANPPATSQSPLQIGRASEPSPGPSGELRGPSPEYVAKGPMPPLPIPAPAPESAASAASATAADVPQAAVAPASPVGSDRPDSIPKSKTATADQAMPAAFLGEPAEGPQPSRRNPLRDENAAPPPSRSALRLHDNDRDSKLSKAAESPSAGEENGHRDSAKKARPGDRPAASGAKTKKGKHSGVPFDPIAVNGKYFENWPKPKLALVMTGRQDGYLEPCGCAGLDRMKGGLMRRHTFFEELRRQRGWEVVGLDVGGLIKGFGRQAELKFQTTVSAMQKMGYDAIGFGEGELRLPTGELVSVAAGVDGKPSPFISANVGLFGFASGLTGTKRVLEAGGRKLGVTAVLGEHYQKQIHNAEIEFAPPEAAIRKVLAELKTQRCDLLVLLAYAPLEETRDLAAKFPDFDVVVAAGVGEPPDKPEKLGEKTLLIEVGEKGMGAVVLGLFDEEPRVRYQRVLLDSRYASSPDIKRLFAAYQDQLKDLGLAGLGVRVAAYPQRELLGPFVGSAKCEPCHEESYRIWKRSGHAKAYATLVEADPPRNFDPECISCHVIGWHPTKYFPYQGGFLSKEKTPHLTDVGCEACHGAGGNHCDAETKNDPALQEKLRKALVVTKAEAEKRFCATCHDLDNSPDFDFATYWPEIEHYEKE